jgi:hypothetical protein
MTGREINKIEKELLKGNDGHPHLLLNALRKKNTEIAKLKNKVKRLEIERKRQIEWDTYGRYRQG